MERKYYRQREAYDKVIPRPEDFPPVFRAGAEPEIARTEEKCGNNLSLPSLGGISLKTDDVILLGLIVLLLMEDNKDYLTIGLLAAVFLAEYIL